LSQPRRIDSPVVQKLGRFAAVMGAAWLAASFALLVLIGASSGAVAAAATMTTTQATATTPCFPLSESSGHCYNAGEFCPNADLLTSGVAANGSPIACESDGGQQPHWEVCTPVSFTATASSTAIATPICPVALAGGAAPTGAPTGATPSATTGAPAGAPATGGGTGPGASATLAAAGCAVMVIGAGLVVLARKRSRRKPV
jgi:hypothetical protein